MNIIEAFELLKQGKIIRAEMVDSDGESDVVYWSASKESPFEMENGNVTYYEIDRFHYSSEEPSLKKLTISSLYRVPIPLILSGKFSVVTIEQVIEEKIAHWKSEQKKED